MAAPKTPKRRAGAKDSTKKIKKKQSIISAERVEYIDYKDVNLLQRFMSDRSKIRARRVSGNDVQQQRDVALAIKNAREMALLPYAKRVTTQRGPGRGERGERGDRGDRGSRFAGAEAAAATADDLAAIDVDADVETDELIDEEVDA